MLRIVSLIMISLFLMGVSSCEEKPDAYKCVSLLDENNQIYLRCRNSATEQTFNAGLEIIGKCIRSGEPCVWIMTDEIEYNKLKDNFTQRCLNGATN